MSWLHPQLLLLTLPALGVLYWFQRGSVHPMGSTRRRALLFVRSLLILLVVACLANPARIRTTNEQSVVFLLDHSKSIGADTLKEIYERANLLAENLPADTRTGFVSIGKAPTLLQAPALNGRLEFSDEAETILSNQGAGSNFEKALRLASAILPGDASQNVVIVGDGVETGGSLDRSAREAAISGLQIHAVPVRGEALPDVRLTSITPSQAVLREGASLELTAITEGSLSGPAQIALFENGIRVATNEFTMTPGTPVSHRFERTPPDYGLYRYRAVIEGFSGQDTIPENNESVTVVDVRGNSQFLYVEGDEGDSHFLREAMEREGIQLEVRSASEIPTTAQGLSAFDGVILSNIAATELGETRMRALREYVETLGGGMIMIGGPDSFGAGGYEGTPIAGMLPVSLRGVDQEEIPSSALALVIDRSGSMAGAKLEICKSAAVATAGLLTANDFIGVYAFDSQVEEVVPMVSATATDSIKNRIFRLGPGGGTHIYPGMVKAREALNGVSAKIKHMIVLTDGETVGQGYEALAAQCQSEGITISTVAVGSTAQISLLRSIASAGGGTSYVTQDPTEITRIFAQDTLTHTGRLIRETPFVPILGEPHPMLRDWSGEDVPPLLGYVRTRSKATAQVPLVTDEDEPLLAQWQFGAGKVTAFTSGVTSRWAGLWIENWPGYSALWSQILRETGKSQQSDDMDLSLEEEGGRITLRLSSVEGVQNPAIPKAEVTFSAFDEFSGAPLGFASPPLQQTGSRMYEGHFRVEDPGIYQVTIQQGSVTDSIGYSFQPSEEASTSTVNEALLRKVCEMTGGSYLESESQTLELTGTTAGEYSELWPFLMKWFLVLLFVDVAIRRWDAISGWFRSPVTSSEP